MKLINVFLFGLITTLVSSCTSYSVQDSTLLVLHKENQYELTVPASRLKMIIPAMGLKEEKSKVKSYRYFILSDAAKEFTVSGWFEPASQFQGFEQSWDAFVSKLPKKIVLSDIKFGVEGEWQYATYHAAMNGCNRPNLKAHLVQDGTWIEIHVSSSCNATKSSMTPLDYLSRIKVLVREING